MKQLYIIITYICVSVALLLSCRGGNSNKAEAASVDTIPMMLQQMQQCSRLYTAEYRVHKIITHNDEASLRGRALGKDFNVSLPVGKRKVAIPVNAVLKAYIDMSEIKPGDVRRHGDKIEVVLPKPHVVMVSSSIDHDNIKQYVSLLRGRFTDEELSSYEKQGRKAIIDDIPQMSILDMARRSAARQLIPIISRMGWKQENITVTFIETDGTVHRDGDAPSGEQRKGGMAWVLD